MDVFNPSCDKNNACKVCKNGNEKAYELKPDEPDYKYALRNIYYNLNDAEKLKAIEGQ